MECATRTISEIKIRPSSFLPSSEVWRWEPDRETEEGMELQGKKGKRLVQNKPDLRAVYINISNLI